MRYLGRLVVAALSAGTIAFLFAPTAEAVPEGFQREYLYPQSHLVYPTNLEFAPDGRLFVTEKRGILKTAASPGSPMQVVADLRSVTHSYWDRGMLGLAVHPDYPATPYVYVLYTHGVPLDVPGGPTVIWEDGPEANEESCPPTPGGTTDGCVVSAQLARLTVDFSDLPIGPEDIEILIHDWCQQFPSHSIGDLVFGPDDALYVSAGDGASFGGTDFGNRGGTLSGTPTPRNPCGDPPGGAGGVMVEATAQGGALRSQSLMRPEGPVVPNGAILRINPLADPDDPESLVLPDNPGKDHHDPIGKLVVAYGLRNPYRFTIRPGTNDLYVADVGYNTWEEVNRHPDATSDVLNFGWPCYEGGDGQSLPEPDYSSLGACQAIDSSQVTAPFFSYRHNHDIEHPTDDDCPPAVTGQTSRTSSSTTGIAFYEGDAYPSAFKGALFGSDYSRECLWVMTAGPDGVPDPDTVQVFHYEPTVWEWVEDDGEMKLQPKVYGVTPVDLEMGPDGRLYGVSFMRGQIFRFNWLGSNQAPVARFEISEGSEEDQYVLDGSGSFDPDEEGLTYAWDLNGDGQYDGGNDPVITHTFPPGFHTVSLRVTDSSGASNTAQAAVINGPQPEADIVSPSGEIHWAVGDQIVLEGQGRNSAGNPIPGNRLRWRVFLNHCAQDSSCHQHHVTEIHGESGTFTAPDHEESSLQIVLEVLHTDSRTVIASDSVVLDPKTVVLTFESDVPGIEMTVRTIGYTTPFSVTSTVGSQVSITAPSVATSQGRTYEFAGWSHGGGRNQTLTTPAQSTTYRAEYVSAAVGDGVALVDMSTARWTIIDPQTGHITSFVFGRPGDHPILGDWDCDGIQTPGAYRRSDGMVYLRNSLSAGNAHHVFKLGRPDDFPLAGDFDGDDCDTVSVYRASERRIFVVNELGTLGKPLYAEHSYVFGTVNDRPFVGDFDGNGADEVAMHRESNGTVYIRNSLTSGFADETFVFGRAGDRVVAGMWDPNLSDTDTVGVYRPGTGILYLKNQNAAGPADIAIPFGGASVWPVAGRFER